MSEVFKVETNIIELENKIILYELNGGTVGVHFKDGSIRIVAMGEHTLVASNKSQAAYMGNVIDISVRKD